MKRTVKIIVIGFLSGLAGAWVHGLLTEEKIAGDTMESFVRYAGAWDGATSANESLPVDPAYEPAAPVNFSDASARAIPSVVFIRSISEGVSYSYWDFLFGEGSQTRVSSGSGVIFPDGYIVTNNHVVSSAERIEVVHDKRAFRAELVGTDPSTDLAVLKVNSKGLPPISLGTSSDLRVGEWVIAVGNPFSLSSTVTAGIVSAKGRRIGILEDKFPIESFIQTDAAINPGNSGGALVNQDGQLVGINTAILSRTGSYTGYAFAVPVDIVKKVVDDLIKYGIVQKAFFGGGVVDYNYEAALKYDLSTDIADYKGVLVERIERDGPAGKAGLRPGDIVTRIDNATINSQSEFEESLSYHYPGDKIEVTFSRNGKIQSAAVTLVNKNGGTSILRRKIYSSGTLGAQLEGTDYGVKVFNINDDSYLKRLGVPENYTILSINRVKTNDPQEVIDFFEEYRGRVNLYGMTASKQVLPFNFVLR